MVGFSILEPRFIWMVDRYREAMSLALIAFAMLRKRRAMTPKHRHPFEVNFEIKHS